ncbi:unnamed protein product [Ambrosiozyma monospora]|nr:unnamed protein product [Ambrosiozyma monospora]
MDKPTNLLSQIIQFNSSLNIRPTISTRQQILSIFNLLRTIWFRASMFQSIQVIPNDIQQGYNQTDDIDEIQLITKHQPS